jgi:Domain of unknown function (DUF6468)
MLPLLVDGLIVVLLLVVLGRGLRLQRSLRQLRHDDGEIDRLIAALDRATARAQAALDGLRQTAEATGERLAGQLASTQRLVDDLHFLTSRGEQAADRLVEQIRKERPAAQPKPTMAADLERARPPGRPHRAVPAADLERTLRTLR